MLNKIFVNLLSKSWC